jgi:hypothetical protein
VSRALTAYVHGGYAVIFEPDVKPKDRWERDTCQCKHCDHVIYLKPGFGITKYLIQHADGHWTEEDGAFCRICMGPVCLRCDKIGRCIPLEKKIEAQEARDRFRRQAGL